MHAHIGNGNSRGVERKRYANRKNIDSQENAGHNVQKQKHRRKRERADIQRPVPSIEIHRHRHTGTGNV